MRWVIATLFVGCADEPARETLSVFAASSLTDALGRVETAFEEARPDVDVQVTFAGSQVLRLQIEHGARADIFVSADERHVDALVEAGDLVEPKVVAYNELAVIVPRNRPGIERFEDLPHAERIVVGSPEGPVGAYTREVLQRARRELGEAFGAAVERNVVSEEPNVRLVRAKVELGEADAAFVYRSDVSGSVEEVPIPESLQVRARYSAGVTRGSRTPQLAGSFLEHLRGAQGQATLSRHGFLVQDEG